MKAFRRWRERRFWRRMRRFYRIIGDGDEKAGRERFIRWAERIKEVQPQTDDEYLELLGEEYPAILDRARKIRDLG